MSLWDANLSELAQACADAGHRPLDRDHVLTCAVDACRELCEVYENTVTTEERDSEVGEIERERDEARRAAEEAEKERDEARRERARAEDALETMTAECERLSEALEGDAGELAKSVLEARQEAREARDALYEFKRGLADRLRSWASQLDRKGARKDSVIRGLRGLAMDCEEA